MTPAEHHAILIRKAISEARAAGVEVLLDVVDGYDGEAAELSTVEYEQVDGIMRIVDGPFIVEAY